MAGDFSDAAADLASLETEFSPASQTTLEGKPRNTREYLQRVEARVSGAVVAEFGDIAAEAKSLASRMSSDAADAIAFAAELGEEVPIAKPLLGTLRVIREKMEAVKSNREELTSLEERCTYITACVIVKSRQNSRSQMDVTRLEECVEAVHGMVLRCSRQGYCRLCLQASTNKDKIAELTKSIRDSEIELTLAGTVTVEGKVDHNKSLLESINKKQDVLLRNSPKQMAKLAMVPKGTPARKSWHVKRQHVMEAVFKVLAGDGEPRLVGLVGDSGSGKTTAVSEIVRSTEVREAFSDGIAWLTVNDGARDRLPSLMLELARMVYQDILKKVARAPSEGDGAAYIKHHMETGHGGKGLRCLLVADNVWEKEVVSKLADTGMWVLLPTRDEELVSQAMGEVVRVDELTEENAMSVLRNAAELSPEVDLPDDAKCLIELCDHVAMDVAFVGRWSIVRGRKDKTAWSDAANKVRDAKVKVRLDAARLGRVENTGEQRRKAILQAGFEDVATGVDDTRVQLLYLSLAVLPDGHAFTVRDAAVLLCERAPGYQDETSVGSVVKVLERWAVLNSAEVEGTYWMHDAHSEFARERLQDRGRVRRSAVDRWAKFISSLDTLRSNDVFFLKRLWLAVQRVGGNDCSTPRPYVAAVSSMDDSDPLLIATLEKMGWFQDAQGDWAGASTTCERLLRVQREKFGDDDPTVYFTLRALAFCAEQNGKVEEQHKWQAEKRSVLPSVAEKMESKVDSGEVKGVEDATKLSTVGKDMSNSVTNGGLKEKLLKHSLAILENELGDDDVRVAYALYDLGYSARQSYRPVDAETLLRRSLNGLKDKRGEDVRVAFVLYSLGVSVRQLGRLGEAEELLERCLAIRETELGLNHVQAADTLLQLGIICVRRPGKLEDAEKLFRRCLGIKEANLHSEDDVRLAPTLHELGVCVQKAGRPEEAEVLLRRCMAIKQKALGPDDVGLAKTLCWLGACVRDEGRLGEAEGLLRRCLGIVETKMPPDGVVVEEKKVSDLQLDNANLQLHVGWLIKARGCVKQCLAFREAELGCKHASVDDILQELSVHLQEL